MKYLFFFFCLWIQLVSAQKEVYIPAYIQDPLTVDGSQFTWSKTSESENFTIIWGDSVGLDPLVASNPDLVFNPLAVLDTLERIYSAFEDLGFAQDIPGTNLHQYKIPVIMLNTFGPSGATGWAFGGDVDGVIGAFWVHPLAIKDGHVAAHELIHSLQAQCVIDYRAAHGLGTVWNHAGIFWETHANFMRNLLYPQDVSAWGMDVYHIETWGDWKNTYENYPLLMAIMEADGIDIINRLWRESLSEEYPLETYKRLSGITQDEFNNKLFEYARRMATYDFTYNNIGTYFRQYRKNDLMYWLPSVQATYTILRQDILVPTRYSVPMELAPEEYAYNIIPIHPDNDSCAVLMKFKGHLEVNDHAGWRYGFVAAYPDGTISRYSDTYDQAEMELGFELNPDEAFMYLVVMGAPTDDITTNPTNDTWKGYPKHFRYPYELTISGGFPEGFQDADLFRNQLKGIGSPHSNGGGWVENSASVSTSVYVGPHAMVLGNSTLTGNARIDNTALVKDANISGNAYVFENAFMLGGTMTDDAIVRGQAFSENNILWDNASIVMRAKVSNYKLHGNIEVGGDVIVYNNSGDCDNGVYYRMTNYYEDNLLECDDRTASHPDNLDVNNPIIPFTEDEMSLMCHCDNYPECLTVGNSQIDGTFSNFMVYPNPAANSVMLKSDYVRRHQLDIYLYDALNRLVLQQNADVQQDINLDVSTLSEGIYLLVISEHGKSILSEKIVVQR